MTNKNYCITYFPTYVYHCIKKNPKKWSFFIFILMYYYIIKILLGDSILVTGNLHDLFIPQLSAKAIKDGLILNHEFHTPFGYIYHYLNYFSLTLIERFPNIFTQSDMIMLSSVLFSFIVISIFLLVAITTRNAKTIQYLIIILILSTLFQVRNVEHILEYKNLLWYGVYNKHLWAILLLQILHVFSWSGVTKEVSCIKINYKTLLLFSLIQSVCIYISFNYKFNFFIASSFVAGSALFFLAGKLKFVYALVIGILLTSFTLLTALVFGYSYPAYLNDLLHIIQSKSSLLSFKYFKHFMYFILFSMLFVYHKKIILREYYTHSFKKLIHGLSNGFPDSWSLIQKSYLNIANSLLFFIFIGLGVLVGVLGDYERPNLYFLIVFLMYVCLKTNKSLTRFSSLFILLFVIVINITSLAYLSLNKLNEEKTNKYIEVNLFGKSKDIIIKNSLDLDHKTLESYKKFEDYKTFILNTALLDEAHEINKTQGFLDKEISFLIRLYFLHSTNFNLEKETKLFNDHSLSILRHLRHRTILWNNERYYSMFQDSIIRIKNIDYSYNDKIMILGFSNHLPVVLNSRLAPDSYHWVHLGTTFSEENIYKLYNTFKNHDVIYIPTVTADWYQPFLNCVFYNWNLKSNQFGLHSTNQYGKLFLSKYKLGVENIGKKNQDNIKKYCAVIESYVYNESKDNR